MKEKNEDVPIVDLGYLPAFDPRRLSAMGQYTDPAQADIRVGANQDSTLQNYRRHELRTTVGQFFELGRSSHAMKAGAAFEVGEETLSRVANGWGAITTITQNGVPALRARYYTPQAPQLGHGRTYSLFIQDDIVLTNRTSVNAGLLLNRDDFSQQLAGSGGCPSTIALRGGAAVYESHG